MRTLAANLLSVRDNPAAALVVALPLAAALVGVSSAADARLAIAITMGLVYLGIAFINLQLAVALWFPLTFLEALPAFNAAAKAGGLVIVGLWLLALPGIRGQLASVLRRNAKLWLALAGLLLWCSLSLLWASDRGMVLADLWHWYAVALLMLIVATSMVDRRAIVLIAAAFVAGAVLSVGQGVVGSELSTSATAIDTASEPRLSGGKGDPNFLAAGIVPAMALALALFAYVQRLVPRWLLIGAMAVLALGLAASQSRGGAVAALLAVVAGLVVFRDRRTSVLALTAGIIGVAAAWFAFSPGAWERVTDFDSGGSGRNELWTVAWRMVESNPVHGVGLNNYPAVSGEYVSEPGSLERLDLIVDRAQVAHNAYLQLLAETGIIGLGLFLAVIAASIGAAWRAAQRFQAGGETSLHALAQGVVVATIALLAAAFFISNGVDKRLWVLLALGPATLAAAGRTGRDEGEASPTAAEISGAAAYLPPAQRERPSA